jgi:hypothetical protein
MYNNETKDKFIELRLKGHTLAKISEAIGVSKTTLVEWNRDCQQQLRDLRSTELEILHDRILQSYEADFERLHRFQRGVDDLLGNTPKYAFTHDNVVELDQVIRRQIRDLRKDIELFGRITDDARNPVPSFLKSETSTPKVDPIKNPWPPRSNTFSKS